MKRKLYFYICVVICCCFALSNISMVEGGVEEEYVPSTTCEEKTVHEYYFNSELGVNIEEKSYEVKNSNEGDKGILDTILKSTVLVGIITALFNWRQHNNTNSLKYITEERQKWREKIRDIAKNIEAYQYSSDDKDKQKLKEILVELKVNINPYGKENEQENKNIKDEQENQENIGDKGKQQGNIEGKKNEQGSTEDKEDEQGNTEDKKNEQEYLKDGHIWAIIKKLEEKQETNEERVFSKNKDKLIDYLSCLLKYDWERAKYEVEQKSLWIRGLKVYVIWVVLMIWIGILFVSFNIEDIMYRCISYVVIIIIVFLPHLKNINFKINKLRNKVESIQIGIVGIICFFITIISIKHYNILVSNTNKSPLFEVLSHLRRYLEKCCIESIFFTIVIIIYWIIIYSVYIEDKQRYEIIQEDYIKQLEMVDGIELIKFKNKILKQIKSFLSHKKRQ